MAFVFEIQWEVLNTFGFDILYHYMRAIFCFFSVKQTNYDNNTVVLPVTYGIRVTFLMKQVVFLRSDLKQLFCGDTCAFCKMRTTKYLFLNRFKT